VSDCGSCFTTHPGPLRTLGVTRYECAGLSLVGPGCGVPRLSRCSGFSFAGRTKARCSMSRATSIWQGRVEETRASPAS
jgi:hypothetical protein